ERERRPQLDQRHGATHAGGYPLRGGFGVAEVTGAHRGQRRATWLGDIHHPAARQVDREGPAGLLLDARPRALAAGGKLAVQVVHCWLLLVRSPMPSEPSAGGAEGDVDGDEGAG